MALKSLVVTYFAAEAEIMLLFHFTQQLSHRHLVHNPGIRTKKQGRKYVRYRTVTSHNYNRNAGRIFNSPSEHRDIRVRISNVSWPSSTSHLHYRRLVGFMCVFSHSTLMRLKNVICWVKSVNWQ